MKENKNSLNRLVENPEREKFDQTKEKYEIMKITKAELEEIGVDAPELEQAIQYLDKSLNLMKRWLNNTNMEFHGNQNPFQRQGKYGFSMISGPK